MRTTAIIPARLGSTRFPGKVLADQTGWPLIRHVHEAASRIRGVDRVVVATDDARVASAVKAFGGEAVMTSVDHPNGTSRLAEAARLLGLGPDEVVVNVQGDEPELEPALAEAAVGALEIAGAAMSTVAVPFGDGEDPRDPNLVKVVRGRDGAALYFSRSLVPYPRADGVAVRPLKHVGLYVYRRAFLDVFLGLPAGVLEGAEMLEQLRVLEAGHTIGVAVCEVRTFGGIDTPEQYAAFVTRWRARMGA